MFPQSVTTQRSESNRCRLASELGLPHIANYNSHQIKSNSVEGTVAFLVFSPCNSDLSEFESSTQSFSVAGTPELLVQPMSVRFPRCLPPILEPPMKERGRKFEAVHWPSVGAL